jgi:ferredoxin
MLLSAAFFALLFEGHVWCQYISPLGQMVATFGRTAVVEVRTNYNYCSNQFHSYECYSGSGDIEGCKMAKGPFALESNQNCNLCGNCIKVCPNESVRINLRPPGWELITSYKADLALLLFVPMLWGTQIFRGLDLTSLPVKIEQATGSMHYSYALIMIVSVVLAYLTTLIGWATTKFVFAPGNIESSRFVFAMLPLVYANEIAIRLAPLLNHAADFFIILGNQIGYEFPHIAFKLDMGSIYILQIMLIAVGLLFSLSIVKAALKKFAGKYRIGKIMCALPLFAMATVSVILL